MRKHPNLHRGRIDRLLHDAEILTINRPSWRLRGRSDVVNQRSDASQNDDNGSRGRSDGASEDPGNE